MRSTTPLVRGSSSKGFIPDRFRRCQVNVMPNLRTLLPCVVLIVMATSACRLDMHVQPRFNPLAKNDFLRTSARRARSWKARLRAVSCAPMPISIRARSITTLVIISHSQSTRLCWYVGGSGSTCFARPVIHGSATEMGSSHLADFRGNRRPITLSDYAKPQSDISST